MVRSLARGGKNVSVALASARGLVHAKIFHVEWLTTGGSRAHTLVYGSGNATRQAFDGFNSELMCKARLTISNHASILDWLQRVRMAACCPADHDRSEEHTSELQSLMRNSYAVFCLKKKKL